MTDFSIALEQVSKSYRLWGRGSQFATLPDPSEIGPMIVELAGNADPGLPTQANGFKPHHLPKC